MRSLIRGTSGFEKEAATQVPEQQPAQRHDPQLDRPADALVANVRPVSIAPSCARFSGTHAKLTAQFGDVDARGICIEIGCRYLNNNQLSGTIPSSIGQLGQLLQMCAPGFFACLGRPTHCGLGRDQFSFLLREGLHRSCLSAMQHAHCPQDRQL